MYTRSPLLGNIENGFKNSLHAVEVHLLDKEINLLGNELIIEPVHKIRMQKKFDSIEALSNQISLDAIFAKEILTKASGFN